MMNRTVTMVLPLLPGLMLGLLLSCSFLPRDRPVTYPAADAANRFFQQEKWADARAEFENYLLQFPQDHEARLKLGRAYLALGQIPEAHTEFISIISQSSKFPAEAYFWAGRASHMLGHFSEAETHYRKFVGLTDTDQLGPVNYYLQQIGSAKKAGVADTWYLVENAGSGVNSSGDEFQPVFSPNVDQRFYFSIDQRPDPAPGLIVEQRKPSMSTAEIRQGFWSFTGPLDPDLTGDAPYYLVDFSGDGQQVYFKDAKSDTSGTLYIKNFGEDGSGITHWAPPFFNPVAGDRDLFVLHDSAFLFSSQSMEGYGGYDLYVAYKRLGEWVIRNLGSEINGPYDEISPFLSRDGRELYFSSNRPESIGGFDVFNSVFEDDTESWTPPANILPPVNSGRNEVSFRLSPDGKGALMVSDRHGGYGGLDIYHIHFDEARSSQTMTNNNPRFFYHVRAYKSFHPDQKLVRESAEKPVYTLPVIPFRDRPVVLTPKIRVELERVLGYCRLYPHTRLLLRIFTDRDVTDQFGLYRPILVLKNITDFLQAEGLPPSRYEVRLYGNQYPRYSPQLSALYDTEMAGSLSNQRMEIDLINTENLPVRFGVPVISDDTGAVLSPYQEWQLQTQKLYFRIKLVESDQLIKGSEYYQFKDLMVLITQPGEHFVYFAGVFPNLDAARKARLEYQARGYNGAEVVAFMGSSVLSDDRINPALIEEYPQLKEYIIYQE